MSTGRRVTLYIILIMAACLFFLFMSSCNSERHFLKQANKHPEWLKTTDSVITKVVYNTHDSLITIKGDKVEHDSIIQVNGPCPEVVHTSHNTGASIRISEKHDTLFADCKADSLKRVISIKEKQIEELQKKTIVIPPPAPKPPTFFQKLWDGYSTFCEWFTSIILIIILSYTGFRAFNVIKKIPGLPF